jgi:hypothetical protein
VSSRNDAVQRFFKAHRKLFAGLALVALIAALAAAAVRFYLYRAGPGYAFANLHAALVEGDKARLADMVDFRALSEELVLAALAVYPQAAGDETRKARSEEHTSELQSR